MTALRRAIALLSLAPALLVAGAHPAGAVPVAEIDDTEVTIGQQVTVTGSGWPASTMVTVQLCGNQAMNGSADCDQASTASVGVRGDGTFGTRLTVGRPPAPCPCVIKATGESSAHQFLARIKILGLPEVEPRDRVGLPEITRLVRFREASLERTGGWTTWFGAAPTYRLVVTLENTGNVALHDLPISFAWGRGADPTGFVAAPDVPSLEAGAETTLEVPVTLDALAIGGYDVLGRIDGIGAPVETRVHTTTYPWGLIVVPGAILAQLTLLSLRNRLRTWIQRRERRRAPVPTMPWPAALDLPALERSAPLPVPVPALDLTSAERAAQQVPAPAVDAERSPGEISLLDLAAVEREERAAPVLDLVALERFLATEAHAPDDDLLPNRGAGSSNVDIDLTVEALIDDLLPASQRRR